MTAGGGFGVIKGINLVLARGVSGLFKRGINMLWMVVEVLTKYKEEKMRILVSEYSFACISVCTC